MHSEEQTEASTYTGSVFDYQYENVSKSISPPVVSSDLDTMPLSP